MIILHAGRIGKQFFLWCESPAENETPVVRRGRKPKNPIVKPYPYDSGVENLLHADKRTGFPLCCSPGRHRRGDGRSRRRRGEEDLLEVLEEIYKKASPAGMMIFLGERK
jgi:hypothetical protein